jgi:hypothetical protein
MGVFMVLYIVSCMFFLFPAYACAMSAVDYEVGQTNHDEVIKAFNKAGYSTTVYNKDLDTLTAAKISSYRQENRFDEDLLLGMGQLNVNTMTRKEFKSLSLNTKLRSNTQLFIKTLRRLAGVKLKHAGQF